MSSQAPWEKYQKQAESGPWEKYQPTKQTEDERRAGQSFMQNWTENAGAMYEGDAEGLPAQAAGGLTALGMIAPAMLPAALPVGAARMLADPRVGGAIAGVSELVRTGDPGRALIVGAAGATATSGVAAIARELGKQVAKRAITREAAAEALRAAVRAERAAKMRTSTSVPSAGGATATRSTPGEVVPFPTSQTMRVPAPAAAPVKPSLSASAPATAAAPKMAPAAPDPAALVRFGREAAARDPKVGEQIWYVADAAGQPLRVVKSTARLTADEKAKGYTMSWIKNLWKK